MDKLRVALVGYGYWGPNLARNIAAHPRTQLVGIIDKDPVRIVAACGDYPFLQFWPSLDHVIGEGQAMNEQVDAVVVATPPETHPEVVHQALRAEKHVLCEKPIALDVKQADEMLVHAVAVNKLLMVDHVFCHSTPARKIKDLIDNGELGDLLYIDSTRINLGLFQQHCSVVWDLAVHDLALIDFFYPELEPRSVSAQGTKHYTDYHDTAHINLTYRNSKAITHIHVNWLSPVKVRQMIIAGTDKSVVWNDMDPVEPVRVYSSGAVLRTPNSKSKRYWQMEYRRGDIWTPALSKGETLQNVIGEFADAIELNREPSTDGRAGLRVVRQLELASISLQAVGQHAVFIGR